MTVTILRGDALHLPLADESVDLVCTSPPYFALRSYTDGGAHYPGQIGSEATPQEWLEALWAATAEMARVLKPGGSIFVNLGDKYAGSGGGGVGSSDGFTGRGSRPPRGEYGIPAKSLMLLPERYRIGAVDQLGLIARAVIIWDKPNGLPESVTDRVRRSHEDWVHLTKQPRYYSAVDEVRQPHDDKNKPNGPRGRDGASRPGFVPAEKDGLARRTLDRRTPPEQGYNALGKLPGSVWQIPSQPLTVPPELGVDHFAAFPTEWPRRIIAGWSPPGICQECGQGRRPVADRIPMQWRPSPTIAGRNAARGSYQAASGTMLAPAETRITGYVCACTPYTDYPGNGGQPASKQHARSNTNPRPGYVGELWQRPRTGPTREYHFDRWTPPPTRPAVVLDPFSGTGTTVLVADVLGRHGIGVDLSADYCRLARWRTTEPAQRARAARVDKPPSVIDGQLALDAEDLGGAL